MKLDNAEFKLYKELSKLVKSGKASPEQVQHFKELDAKKQNKGNGSNDLSWWNRYPILTQSVKNVAFNHIPGETLDSMTPRGSLLSVGTLFAGVARVGFVNAIGRSLKSSNGFNAQVRQLFLDLHRKYRGIGAYQRSDVGMNLIAIIDFFLTLAKFERIYGAVNTYKIMNRNVPYAIYSALHIDSSVDDDLANFRYQLNVRIEKAKQLCLPRGLAALEEKITLVSNAFKDSDNERASIFLWDTDEYGVYDPILLSTGGCVKFTRFKDKATGTVPATSEYGFTVSDMMGILDEQLDALLDDDDIARICSDIIACYGKDSVVVYQPVEETHKLPLIYDYERQLQFHNVVLCGYTSTLVPATYFGSGTRANSNIIFQENNVIIDNRVCQCNAMTGTFNVATNSNGDTMMLYTGNAIGAVPSGNVMYDVWKDSPDDTDIICGSRFVSLAGRVVSVTDGGNTYVVQDLISYGTEICTDLNLYQAGLSVAATFRATLLNTEPTGAHYLSQFDWHPAWYIIGTAANITAMNRYGDADNPTIIMEKDLKAINDNCVYSLFAIPFVEVFDK